MKTKQLIAFLRGKVYVSSDNLIEMTEDRKIKLMTLTEELKKFGYSLSPEALFRLTEDNMVEIYDEILPYLHEQYHPGTLWAPLYPGFPVQVMDMTDAQLWENQHKLYETMDYEEFKKNNPWYTTEEQERLEKISISAPSHTLGILTESDLLAVFTSIVASGNSLQVETREELKWFLENYPDYKLPTTIPFKETKCIVMSYRPDLEVSEINDVLRYGIYQMGGSPELVHVPKKLGNAWGKKASKEDNPEWRNLKAPRCLRKDLMRRIEAIVSTKGKPACIPDAKRFYGHWLILSEKIHPGEYTTLYPRAADFFATLKSTEQSKNYRTWYSGLQKMYDEGKDVVEIAKYVSKRPGELVRRFDSLFRRALESGREFDIMEVFLDTDGMKNKTLLELRSYYEKRASRIDRVIVSKNGRGSKVIKALEPLPGEMVDTVRDHIERKVLINIKNSVKEQDLVDKTVYIDPEINRIPIPSGMRDSLFVVPRATRIPISMDKNIIRMFVHWTQKGRDEDLDLHAYLYKDSLHVQNVGFNTSLRAGTAVVHSGDVLNREGECAEYVDIDIKQARLDGWKYVVMDVYNFKGRGFDTLPCWLGYTTLTAMQNSNKNWVPQNVEYSQKITTKESNIAAWIFDLEKHEAICLGIGLSGIPVNRGNQNTAIIEYFATEPKFTCYDVLTQFYKARGAAVVDKLDEPVDLEVKQEDIISDYTKILEILG